jgi:hypothetical protein
MPMLSPDSITAFVVIKLTSADQPKSALPLDPTDGEVALNIAAFARIATPLLLESLLQFIAVSTGHDPVSLA